MVIYYLILSHQVGRSPLHSRYFAAPAFSFTSFTSFASLTSSKSFTIRTYKIPLPQLLYNPHLQAPLGSAGNKGLITPLESALTRNSPVSLLESALAERWGGGGHSCHSGIRHTLLVTTHYAQVLSFQTIPHSFAFSCASQKLNPFVFMQFRALCEKRPEVGTPLHCSPGKTARPRMPLSKVIPPIASVTTLDSAILSTPEEPPCWNPQKVSY